MTTAHTWHRSHNAANLVREAKAGMTAEKTLENAKEFLAKLENNVNLGGINDEKRRKISGLITNLCTELESKRKNGDADNSAYSTISRGNNADLLNGIRSRRNSDRFGMGSQIFSTYTSNMSLTDSEDEYEDGIPDEKISEETVKLDEIYDRKMPWYLKMIPHMLFFITVMASVYGGGLLLRIIEPSTANSPLLRLILNCFDAGARIGWGASPPKSPQGKLFSIFYTIYIASMVNAFIATIGSMMTNIYCVHWPVLKAKIKGKDPKANDLGHVMSIKVLLYFNVFMLIIGWYLWCYQFQTIGILDVTYFCVMTMMAAAFGDVHPDPKDHFQLIVLMMFFLVGIAIWSGILVILTNYFEIYFEGKLRDYLRTCWINYQVYQEKKKDAANCNNCVCHNDAA